MSRLKRTYFSPPDFFSAFIEAWKNTTTAELQGWEEVAKTQSVSTAAMMWSLWQVWNHQISERGRINVMYVEWLFRVAKLFWPYGTRSIPIATLGLAKCGFSVLNLNEKNATI